MFNNAMKIEEHDIKHISVMADVIGDYLQPREGGTYLDATVGFGGHTYEILRRSDFKSRIIAMDVDKDAIEYSTHYLRDFRDNVIFVNRNFADIDKVVKELGVEKLDGIVADLGMSSYQIDQSGRGFSFSKKELLDMRMSPDLAVTACDIVNESPRDELFRIFRDYGEERFANKISSEIVRVRKDSQIRLTTELCDIVERSIPVKLHPRNIHPATRIFQALRIAVNSELDNLLVFINKSVDLLNIGSRIAVISFHSLEDRIVKNRFRAMADSCVCPPGMPVCGCGRAQRLRQLLKRPLSPSPSEVNTNRRARSARLRVAEKIS